VEVAMEQDLSHGGCAPASYSVTCLHNTSTRTNRERFSQQHTERG
jgi:hypothetical protein